MTYEELIAKNEDGTLEIRTVFMVSNSRTDRKIFVTSDIYVITITGTDGLTTAQMVDICDEIAHAGGLIGWGNG